MPNHLAGRRAHDHPAIVGAVAALSAVGAVFSSAAPTGTNGVDIVFLAAAGVLVSLAAARARRWAWLVAAGLTTIGAANATALALSVAAVLLSVGAVALGYRSRVLGAVVGALVINAALRLSGDWFFGAYSLIAVAAVAPILLSGWRHTRTRHRRPLKVAGLVAAGLVVVAGVALAAVAATSRTDAEAATEHTRRAFDLLSDADAEGARVELSLAADAFRRVEARGDAWWSAPARIVPIAAQHRQAVAALAGASAGLADDLADATAVADIEAIELRDGRLDLAALATLVGPADTAVGALERADGTAERVASGWLVAPLATRVDSMQREIVDALGPARLAAQGARVVPALLGGDEPRSYVVLFANPAESRELGGFVGGVGVLRTQDGELDFSGVEPIGSLASALQAAQLPPISGIPASFTSNRPTQFPQNWTASPDLPTVGRVVSSIWPDLRSEPVDGVLYVDPYAVQAFLALTGPLTVDGIPYPITSDNVVDYVLRDQYELEADAPLGDDSARKEALADIGDAVFERLTTGSLPGPRALADALGPAVEGRHLQLWTADHEPAPFLAGLGMDGVLPAPDGDVFHLTQSNSRGVKLDAYLARSIQYDVEVDHGRVSADATITLRNDADPAVLPGYVTGAGSTDGLPAGTNRINLTLYSPWGLVDGTVGGAPAGASSLRVGSLWQHRVVVTIPPGSTQTVVLHLEGTLDDDDYQLTAVPFASAVPDQLRVIVAGSGDDAFYEGPLRSTVVVDG
jgi:Protein of unknown function (DUF4012)